jgi:hypothetical protein
MGKKTKVMAREIFSFLILLGLGGKVLAMDPPDHENKVKSLETLQKDIKTLEPSWWQRVEVIRVTGNNGVKWETPKHGFFTSWDDPVVLDEIPEESIEIYDNKSSRKRFFRSKVMTRKDAYALMEIDNIQLFEMEREKEKPYRKEYEQQKHLLNYRDATFKGYDLSYWHCNSLNLLIYKDLRKAHEDKCKREREQREEEIRWARNRNSHVPYQQPAKQNSETRADRDQRILNSIRRDESPETQKRKYREAGVNSVYF